MAEFLEIDGSVLEGGGQILRNSMSLSAILGIPVRVTNIRANRKKPGLAAQHLKGIQLVSKMCVGKLKGDNLGSTEIEFTPGKIRGGHYVADPKTAGSISLLLQVSLPCALFADSLVTLDLKGGTNADMAPQIDYMTEVFRHLLRNFKADFTLDINRRGYFPKGGGHVTVQVNPVNRLHNVELTERGNISRIFGWSFVAGVLPIKMAYEMCDGAKSELTEVSRDINIECFKEDHAFDNCSGIVICGETSTGTRLAGDALGRRGAAARVVGRGAGAALRALLDSGACVDLHAQDQLILYMALAEGTSRIRTGEVTLHTQTSIYIVETLTKIKFNIIPEGQLNIIECKGLGLINKNINIT